MSPAGRLSDAERRHELGMHVHLLKPVRRRELQRAVSEAIGRARAHSVRDVPAASAPRSLRILLAEDSPVNQKLAVLLLSKRGHAVTVVGDGREAVTAVENGAFDLVLMDVHMPEMSGLEATAAIRARELRAGGHLPIIALTACAMAGDRERCLEAGMDGYVAKPIQREALFAAIESLPIA
jgi:two-component system, sensor histidine kinase and response regulator